MIPPALIANDMAAHATYWRGRDKRVESLCRDSAGLIRSMLAHEHVDGRRYHGVWRRLFDNEDRYYASRILGWPNFGRARECIEKLQREDRACDRCSKGV